MIESIEVTVILFIFLAIPSACSIGFHQIPANLAAIDSGNLAPFSTMEIPSSLWFTLSPVPIYALRSNPTVHSFILRL